MWGWKVHGKSGIEKSGVEMSFNLPTPDFSIPDMG